MRAFADYLRRHHIGLLALFIAMGGTAYAAALPRNSVGTTQLKAGAVRTSDVARNAITSAKIRNGSLVPADFRAGSLPAGATGPQGDRGPAGPKGDTGTVDTSNFYDKTASDARFLRSGTAGLQSLAVNDAGAANGAEMLAAHSCKQVNLLYSSGTAPAGSRVLTFLADGSPNGLVATPLVQGGTQTGAPMRVCNITAGAIDIDGVQYTAIALRP